MGNLGGREGRRYLSSEHTALPLKYLHHDSLVFVLATDPPMSL
jgi:hypothetical protein